MPSLIRFVVVLGVLGGIVFGGLYILAEFFEPVPKEVTKPVYGIKVRTR